VGWLPATARVNTAQIRKSTTIEREKKKTEGSQI